MIRLSFEEDFGRTVHFVLEELVHVGEMMMAVE